MLKNWTVKTKQIKRGVNGLADHSSYLRDPDRPAHQQTKIEVLHGSPKSIVLAYDQRRKQRQLDGKRGGGVRNLATSFVLSLPKDIPQPTAIEWKKMMDIVVEELSEAIEEKAEDMAKQSFIVLHQEEGEKNSHVHFLAGNIVNGEFNKKITQYAGTHAVKTGFNKAVKAVMGVDNYEYIPKQKNVKDKPLWAIRKERNKEIERKAEEEREKTMQVGKKLVKVKKVFKSYANTLATWFDTEDEKKQQRLVKKMQKQINSAFDYKATEEQLKQFKDAAERAERDKKKKTGLNFPKPPSP